jgi:hypothetical protein
VLYLLHTSITYKNILISITRIKKERREYRRELRKGGDREEEDYYS